MNLIEALKQLRRDIQTWTRNNFLNVLSKIDEVNNKLATPRKIQLQGAVVGTTYVDSSDDLILETRLNGTESTTLIGARWTADTVKPFELKTGFSAALNFATELGNVFTGIEVSSESYSALGSQYKLTYITTSGIFST